MRLVQRVCAVGVIVALLPAGGSASPLTAPALVPMVKLPDLVITDAHFTVTNGLIDQVFVTIAEKCGVDVAKAPQVGIEFFDKPGGTKLYGMGTTKSYITAYGVETFDASIQAPEPNGAGQKIPAASYIYITVDNDNRVAEDNEGNNFWSFNPNSRPFPPGPDACKPKPVKPAQTVQ